MDKDKLENYFKQIEIGLQQEFTKIISCFKHSGLKGQVLEQVVINFLSNHLPERFKISSGEIFNVEGKFSRESDVVIYDAEFSPTLFQPYSKQSFFLESVYSLMEVKANLQKPALRDAITKIEKLKSLKIEKSKICERGFLHEGESHRPLGIIFAFNGSKVETCAKNLNEFSQDINNDKRVDIVYIHNKGLIFPVNLETKTVQIPFQGDKTIYCSVTENQFLTFYLILLEGLNLMVKFPPPITKYVNIQKWHLKSHTPSTQYEKLKDYLTGFKSWGNQ